MTIRPGRLSQELGLSINDASAELCGLLKAVGPGSTFKFEEIDGIQTMVFTFPPDFEKLALANERKEDWISFAKDSFGFAGNSLMGGASARRPAHPWFELLLGNQARIFDERCHLERMKSAFQSIFLE